MSYQEVLEHLYGLGRFGIKPGLERIKILLARLSNPQESLRIIHIAGTNGKGSTAAFLSAILGAAGYKAGLFTSPHLVSFTERIRINGAEIEERDVVTLARKVMAAAPEGTTFFEMATAMAILHFAERQADPVILETGMGGRFDATNVVPKLLSIITPISLDHCEYLGDTISQVAREKAGIIRHSTPTVISTQVEEAAQVLQEVCIERGSHPYRFGTEFSALWDEEGLAYQGRDWIMRGLRPGIPGRYQAANAASALCAAELLRHLGVSIDPDVARAGVEQAFWPGRMELIGDSPRVLLDGAHNPAGAAALAESLRDISRNRLFLVLGVMSNKDAEGVLKPLLTLADRILTVTPGMPRSLSSHDLAKLCRDAGGRAEDTGGVARGLAIARTEAGPEDLVVVCGSLFVVGEARAILLSKKFEPCRG